MIKDIIRDAINRLNSEKSSAINTALTKNQNDIIGPKFLELESSKAESVKKINQETSAKIAEISKACEDAKTEFRNGQIEAVRLTVGATYDTAIAKLQKELEEYDPAAVSNKE